jgi:predicted acetyltransferase
VPPTIEKFRTEDAAEFLTAMGMTFLLDPLPDGGAARAAHWLQLAQPDPERTRAAYDAGRIVGTHRTMSTELTLPGGATVGSDSVAAVTVAPTHRRQGLLTRMMTEGLRGAAARGEPVSALYASEWPIYGRFGFGPATQAATWEVSRLRAAPQPAPTGMELVTNAEAVELGRPVYDAARRRRAGGMSRPAYRWTTDFGLDRGEGAPPGFTGYAAVHRDAAGTVDGYLLWHPEDKWSNWRSDSVLHVDELVAANDEAYRQLWRFTFAVDLIVTVRAADRRVDEPLPHLPGIGRAAVQAERSDALWVRVLDVPVVLGARSYGTSGRVVLEVTDPAGFAGGTYALEAGPDGAACKPTGESAELTLPVGALGSAALGGYRLRALAEAGLLDEHRPGAVEAADRLLGTDLVPFCTLHF